MRVYGANLPIKRCFGFMSGPHIAVRICSKTWTLCSKAQGYCEEITIERMSKWKGGAVIE